METSDKLKEEWRRVICRKKYEDYVISRKKNGDQ